MDGWEIVKNIFVAALPLPCPRRVRSAYTGVVVVVVVMVVAALMEVGAGRLDLGKREMGLHRSAALPDPAGQFWLSHGAGRLSEFASLVLLLACQTAWWVKGSWADRHENITKITHPHFSIKSHSHMAYGSLQVG